MSTGGRSFIWRLDEAEMDDHRPDLRHDTDRDTRFLETPHVPLLEEHVGDLVAARFHDQPPDLTDLAVGRTDSQLAAYVYRAGRDVIDSDLLRGFRADRSPLATPR
jgi:hypothetical protein